MGARSFAISLAAVQTAVTTLSDRKGIADSLAGALADIAPHALHAVTFFSGPASLQADAAGARVGRARIDVADFPRSYGTSGVRWDRWSVREEDRNRVRAIEMPPCGLSDYWSRVGSVGTYRRCVVCIGERAVALAGSLVIDDHPLDEATWAHLEATILASVRAIQLAAYAGGALDAQPEIDIVGYLAPDGVVLAAANDAEATAATQAASEALRHGGRRSFAARGMRFSLRPSEGVRDAEVVAVVAERGAALSERDARLVEWVRRGLTNREVGAMLGVPQTTVKRALERLFARHGASNRVELLRLLDGA